MLPLERILYKAAREDNLELVNCAIEKGANVNTIADEAPLFYWLSIKNSEELIKLLIRRGGANVNAANREGTTALHWVCRNGFVSAVKLLIEREASVNVTISNYGWTPLHWACEKGRIEVVKLLIENGANVNVIDIDKLTPLNKACLHNHIELAKWLICHLLLKNVKEKKPNFVNDYYGLSNYWDEQIEKINYLPKKEILGGKGLTETILTKVSFGKNDTLISHSFHRVFKLLDSKKIKNKRFNGAVLTVVDSSFSLKLG